MSHYPVGKDKVLTLAIQGCAYGGVLTFLLPKVLPADVFRTITPSKESLPGVINHLKRSTGGKVTYL